MELIVLGGREFAVVTRTTLGHDLHLTRLVRSAGLSEVGMAEGETPEEFTRRLLEAVIGTGRALDILACLIVPVVPNLAEGKQPETWTRALARRTSAWLYGLCAEEDKAKVRNLICSLLIHFFVNGITSLRSSGMSSEKVIPIDSAVGRAGAGSGPGRM